MADREQAENKVSPHSTQAEPESLQGEQRKEEENLQVTPAEQSKPAPKEAATLTDVPKTPPQPTKASLEGTEALLSSVPKATPEEAPEETPEEAPDPDEDDLSDLDDVLDEFAAVNVSASKPAPTSSGPGRPSSSTVGASVSTVAEPNVLGVPDEDEFAKPLQAGMAELLGEFESSPEMQKQFEDLVKELGDGMAAVQTSEPSGTVGGESTSKSIDAETTADTAAKAEASFQETIRATMERMNASSAAATSATQSSSTGNAEDDFLAAMLREMEASGGDGLGAGGDEDFSKMLLGMMEQLTNKDILYEPMKELHDKFPAWLEVNREKVPKEDLERYEEQLRLVTEIVGKFEEKGYSDEKVEAREYIVERMQKMQAAGSPPPDLVGDMNAAQEAMGAMEDGCAQQ